MPLVDRLDPFEASDHEIAVVLLWSRENGSSCVREMVEIHCSRVGYDNHIGVQSGGGFLDRDLFSATPREWTSDTPAPTSPEPSKEAGMNGFDKCWERCVARTVPEISQPANERSEDMIL